MTWHKRLRMFCTTFTEPLCLCLKTVMRENNQKPKKALGVEDLRVSLLHKKNSLLISACKIRRRKFC